jgi:hypothetical protein
MVSQGVGSIFRRTDGRYFIYLPNDLVEDTAFPFPTEKSVKVKIRFIPGNKKLIIEEYQQKRPVNHERVKPSSQ